MSNASAATQGKREVKSNKRSTVNEDLFINFSFPVSTPE